MKFFRNNYLSVSYKLSVVIVDDGKLRVKINRGILVLLFDERFIIIGDDDDDGECSLFDAEILTGIFDVVFFRLMKLSNGEFSADLDFITDEGDDDVSSTIIDGSCEIARRLYFIKLRCLFGVFVRS